jgi:hypothetical protein
MDTFKNCEIEATISQALVGKAPTTWRDKEWARFYKSMRRVKLSPYQLAEAIWRGYPFTGVYSNRRRIEDNYEVSYHMAFDFDSTGAALEFLMRPGTIGETFASFAYSTPSSTEDHPKSRVVFCIPTGIWSAAEYRILYQAIAAEFGREGSTTDPACKDPLRLYYGSPGAQVITNWSALLPDVMAFLVERYERENPPPPAVDYSTVEVLPASPDFIQRRVDQLRQNVVNAPDGEKHHVLNKMAYTIGGFVGAGQVTQQEAEAIMEQAILENGRAKDLRAARKTILSAIERGAERPLAIEQRRKRDLSDVL